MCIILFIVFPRDGRVEGVGAKSSLANEADFNNILKFKIVKPADNTYKQIIAVVVTGTDTFCCYL